MSDPQNDWRDELRARAALKVHPAAQLFPRLTGPAFEELVDDIRKHGVQEPLVLWHDLATGERLLLDGQNRVAAVEAAVGEVGFDDFGDAVEVTPWPNMRRAFTEGSPWYPGNSSTLLPTRTIIEGDPYEIVLSLNLHRRHLRPEERRELIAKLLKADPTRSDRRIAATVKASPTTVGTVRAGLEQAGDVSNLDTRIDSKGRQQPARKVVAPEPPKPETSIALDQWQELGAAAQAALLTPNPALKPGHFNKQENDAIEWAMWSWNPITGCLHDCPYCYARDIANSVRMARSYPNGFRPTLRPGALLTPRFMKVPPEAAADTRWRNVFTGSMADIFGRWVPAEWIEAVLTEIRNAPNWNFLCLTKFPKRMAEFDIPANAWMGTTVDLQARVAAAEAGFANVGAKVKWLSCEPLLEPLRFKHLDRFNWIVIGGASRSTKTPEWRPPFEWIADLVAQARRAGLRVYFKTNLGIENRILELPFDAPIAASASEAPAIFHYLAKTGKQAH